ncbi:MAG: adenylate/guanylate cyclase domain-containing protein [Vicinamibacterales bacterium]
MAAHVTRRLSALLSIDVAGFSRLMAGDELSTVRTLNACKAHITRIVEAADGRIVDATGDNVLAEFPNASDAARSACEIQTTIEGENARRPEPERMHLRIGVHVGEVIVEDARIYGAGINIAARLQALAEPAGICISSMVYEVVQQELDVQYEDLGELRLKNIPQPLHTYRVRLRHLPDAPLRAADPVSGRPALAVLPFENGSTDPEQEYFADGISEDLIFRLLGWRVLPVIARNSSFACKGQTKSAVQIGRELGARYLVAGSVRRSGARVRLSVRATDAVANFQVWHQRFDLEVADIFAVQDAITESIVAAVVPELLKSETDRIRRHQPSSVDAWDAALRGLWHFNRNRKDDNRTARRYLQTAVRLDPELLLAHYGIGMTHYFDLLHHWTESRDASVQGMALAARTCLALGAQDPYTQFIVGMLHLMQGETLEAVAALERSVEANPSFARARSMLGQVLAMAKQYDRGIAEIERAMQLSPKDPEMWSFLNAIGVACMAARRFDDVVKWSSQAIALKPDQPMSYFGQAVAYAHLGEPEKASAALREGLRINPDYSLAQARAFASAFSSDVNDIVQEGLSLAGLR